jgi:hypothetical protein
MNLSVVCHLLGYYHYETVALPALSGLYGDYRCYVNSFRPVPNHQSKPRIDAHASKVH